MTRKGAMGSMSEKKEYYLDFYCPSCGRKHENVRQVRYSEEVNHVSRYDIDCPCGRQISTYASLDWDYVDIVAKNTDGEITVRNELKQKERSESTQAEAEKRDRKNTMGEVMDRIEEWAFEKGLNESDPYVQLAKLMEEAGELAEGIIKDRDDQIADSLGDIFVVITILAMQLNLDIDQCAELAYTEIKDRKGKMINGSFIKEEDMTTTLCGGVDLDDYMEDFNPY